LSLGMLPGIHHAQKPSSTVTDPCERNCAKRQSFSLSTQQFTPLNTDPIAGCRSIRSDYAMEAPRDAPEPDSPYQRTVPPFGDTSGIAVSNGNHQCRLLSLLRDTLART